MLQRILCIISYECGTESRFPRYSWRNTKIATTMPSSVDWSRNTREHLDASHWPVHRLLSQYCWYPRNLHFYWSESKHGWSNYICRSMKFQEDSRFSELMASEAFNLSNTPWNRLESFSITRKVKRTLFSFQLCIVYLDCNFLLYLVLSYKN